MEYARSLVPEVEAPGSEARAVGQRKMAWGAIGFVLGVATSLFNYMAANRLPEGTQIIAWGAIILGAYKFFQGLSERNAKPSEEDIGYSAIEMAARLEAEGRFYEAVSIYQGIIDTYPGTDASRDAQKSIESIKAGIVRPRLK